MKRHTTLRYVLLSLILIVSVLYVTGFGAKATHALERGWSNVTEVVRTLRKPVEGSRPKAAANAARAAVTSPSAAIPDITVVSVLLNGATNATVCAGDMLTANITMTLGGGGAPNQWRGTSWLISSTAPTLTSQVTNCFNNTDITMTGGTQPVTMTAPMTAGIYTAYFVLWNQDTCGGQSQSSPIIVTAGTVTVQAAATVNAGADQTVCATSPAVTLAGSFGGSATSATWSGGAGTFGNVNSPTSTYTPSAGEITAGTATLTLTTNDPAGSCLAVSDTMTITINPAATVNAGLDQTICATNMATLAGSFGGSATSVTWSGGAGTFGNMNSPTSTYTPSAGEITAGTVMLTLTTNDPTGLCGAVMDTMTITIDPAATVNAGLDQTVCATSPAVTLAGSFGGSATSVTWSGGAGMFSNVNSPTSTYTPSAGEITAGTVMLTLTTNDPMGLCGTVMDTMTITIDPAATVNAGVDQTVCATNLPVTLAGSFGGSATSVTWSGGAGTFGNVNSPTSSYTPSAGEIGCDLKCDSSESSSDAVN